MGQTTSKEQSGSNSTNGKLARRDSTTSIDSQTSIISTDSIGDKTPLVSIKTNGKKPDSHGFSKSSADFFGQSGVSTSAMSTTSDVVDEVGSHEQDEFSRRLTTLKSKLFDGDLSFIHQCNPTATSKKLETQEKDANQKLIIYALIQFVEYVWEHRDDETAIAPAYVTPEVYDDINVQLGMKADVQAKSDYLMSVLAAEIRRVHSINSIVASATGSNGTTENSRLLVTPANAQPFSARVSDTINTISADPKIDALNEMGIKPDLHEFATRENLAALVKQHQPDIKLTRRDLATLALSTIVGISCGVVYKLGGSGGVSRLSDYMGDEAGERAESLLGGYAPTTGMLINIFLGIYATHDTIVKEWYPKNGHAKFLNKHSSTKILKFFATVLAGVKAFGIYQVGVSADDSDMAMAISILGAIASLPGDFIGARDFLLNLFNNRNQTPIVKLQSLLTGRIAQALSDIERNQSNDATKKALIKQLNSLVLLILNRTASEKKLVLYTMLPSLVMQDTQQIKTLLTENQQLLGVAANEHVAVQPDANWTVRKTESYFSPRMYRALYNFGKVLGISGLGYAVLAGSGMVTLLRVPTDGRDFAIFIPVALAAIPSFSGLMWAAYKAALGIVNTINPPSIAKRVHPWLYNSAMASVVPMAMFTGFSAAGAISISANWASHEADYNGVTELADRIRGNDMPSEAEQQAALIISGIGYILALIAGPITNGTFYALMLMLGMSWLTLRTVLMVQEHPGLGNSSAGRKVAEWLNPTTPAVTNYVEIAPEIKTSARTLGEISGNDFSQLMHHAAQENSSLQYVLESAISTFVAEGSLTNNDAQTLHKELDLPEMNHDFRVSINDADNDEEDVLFDKNSTTTYMRLQN